jgi:hypothetical protein
MERRRLTETAQEERPPKTPTPVEPAILALQRTAGNQAVCRALLAREDKADKGITGVTVTPGKSTMPLDAGTSITAAAKPGDAGGVKYSLVADSVAPAAGTKIDESTGVVTLDAKQPGGKLKAKATNSVSYFEQPFRVVEKPKDIASTTSAVTGQYEAEFTHTFNSQGAGSSGLDQANINEKFDAHTAKTPFGADFTLSANKKNSKGWFLDNSGTMAGPDGVSISTAGIDAGKFVKSASNPTPAQTLPAGFNMTQKFHAKTYPADTLEDAPFTTTEHVRRLVEKDGKLQFEIAAGKGSETMDYVGPPVFRNAKADKTTVAASPPKPKQGKWAQNEVQVTVDSAGKDPKPKYSIQGEKLGCSVDKDGLVKIGSTAGTITVRAGSATNYDEVTITITAAPTPAVDAKQLDTPGLDPGDDTPEPL